MRSTTLHKYLKSQREKRGLTQRQVSDALGYGTSQFISNWERELCVVPEEKLYELSQLYHCSLRKLFDLRLNDIKNDLYLVVYGPASRERVG